MPELTPDEEMRDAAAKLRETAARATDGPWHAVGQPWNNGEPFINAGSADPHFGTFVADMSSLAQSDEPRERLEADAAWIALVHPGLAGPLATWLDQAALAFAAWGDDALDYKGLAVARAINGTQP